MDGRNATFRRTATAEVVVYWDASAVLSALLRDAHSDHASEWSRRPGLHLLSTLAYAEVCAVIERGRRERLIADVIADAAFEALEQGPYRRLNGVPEWETTRRLARRWPLRGADLWHLAAAVTLRTVLPELVLLSYDTRLAAAADGEGLAPPS